LETKGTDIIFGQLSFSLFFCLEHLRPQEFYKSIAFTFLKVCKNKPFQSITEGIRWSYDERKFAMWSQGKTGFPIVDAGT
jgi:deoxyribodipyrimidine photolyase